MDAEEDGMRFGGAPSGAVCQAKSSGRAVRTARTKVPTPGRLSMSPCAARVRMAFCTVTGLAPWLATSSRVDGSLAPAGADAIQSPSAVTIRELLSLFMRSNNSATVIVSPVLSPSRHGLAWGLVGILAFSCTVPFTRVAVGGLSPLLVGSGRAVIAAVLAAAALTFLRQRLPRGIQWVRLAVVAGGVVVGFPLLTSFALTAVPASHGAAVIALLPAATAVMAVVRGKERPPLSFWIMAVVGAVAAIVFASLQGGGFAQLSPADLLLFGAVVVCAI